MFSLCVFRARVLGDTNYFHEPQEDVWGHHSDQQLLQTLADRLNEVAIEEFWFVVEQKFIDLDYMENVIKQRTEDCARRPGKLIGKAFMKAFTEFEEEMYADLAASESAYMQDVDDGSLCNDDE